MATLIGVVSQVVGEVYAVAGDGTRRPLVEGDRVYAGEQLVTGASGAVAIAMSNGETLTLGRDSSMGLSEQMLAGTDGSNTASAQGQTPPAPSDSDLTDVEQLQAAIEAGVDPTLEGEATAAGPGAGGAGGAGALGGGHSFVLLGEVGGALDPVIGFPTEGLNTGPEFPDPEPIVTPDPEPDSTPTIEIEYADANGSVVAGPAVVDEEALADGSNKDSDAEQANGQIIVTSPDGVSSLQVQGFDGIWVDVTSGGVVVGQYGTLVVDPAGNWIYTLTDNTLDHDDPNATGSDDQVGESFPVRVFDLDGDVSPTVQLQVLVNDDGPTAKLKLDREGGAAVHDETAGVQDTDEAGELPSVFGDIGGTLIGWSQSAGAVVSAAGSSYGADGEGTTVISLQINGGDATSSGLETTDGVEIFLFQEDVLIVGRVANGSGDPDPDGAVAFAVSIDADTGVLSVAQYLSLHHPDPATLIDGDVSSYDEAVGLTLTVDEGEGQGVVSLIQAVVTVTDGDGDFDVSDAVDIGHLVQFEDDGPSVTVTLTGAGAVLTDETTDLNVTKTAEAAAVNITALTGEDNEGATTNVQLVIDNAASGLSTTDGKAITLVAGATDNEVLGRYDSDGNDSLDAIAFKVSVSDSGVLSVTQYVSLHHSDPATLIAGDVSSYDEAETLAGKLSVKVTVTDGDGDVKTGSQSVGGLISFEDDGPSVTVTLTGAGAVLTDETTDLNVTKTAEAAAVNITALTGEDNEGATTNVQLVIDNAASGLSTTDGKAITLVAGATDNEVLGRYDSDGNDSLDAIAFKVSVSDSGVLSVTQYVSLHHSDPATLIAGDVSSYDEAETLAGKLSVKVTVTDGDGDVKTGSQSVGGLISFEDDGPSVTVTLTGAGAVLTDETTDLNVTKTAEAAAVNITALTGEDNEGATTNVQLVIDNAASGLSTTDGKAITLVAGATDNEVLGRYDSDGNDSLDAIAFKVSVSDSGVLSVTQYVSLHHSDPATLIAGDVSSYDEAETLAGKLSVKVTVTDGDGDVKTGSQSVGGLISFKDDGPDITDEVATLILDDEGQSTAVNPGPDAAGIVDGPGDDADALYTLQGDFNFAAGADGLKAFEITGLTANGNPLQAINVNTTTGQGTLESVNVNWTPNGAGGGTYTGVGAVSGNPIFTLVVTASGHYTFTLFEPLAHPATHDGDEQNGVETEWEDNLSLVFGVKITDQDNDSDTATLTINVDDDTLDVAPAALADLTGINQTVSAALGLAPGADGWQGVTFDLLAQPQDLTSGGQAIQYGVQGGVLVGYTTDINDPVFKVTVDLAGNSYSVQLLKPLDGVEGQLVPIGGATAFGAGPTESQLLTSGSGGTGQQLAIVTGWDASGIDIAAWQSSIGPLIFSQDEVNGSTSGWGVGGNTFNDADFMRFDFGDQDFTSQPGVSMPEVSYVNFALTNFGGGAHTVLYVVHYSDGSANAAGAINFNGGNTTWEFTAPAGKTIDYVELYANGEGGGGKVDLNEVRVLTDGTDLNLVFKANIADGDGDVEQASLSVTVTTPSAPSFDGVTATVDEDGLSGGANPNLTEAQAGSDLVGGSGTSEAVFSGTVDVDWNGDEGVLTLHVTEDQLDSITLHSGVSPSPDHVTGNGTQSLVIKDHIGSPVIEITINNAGQYQVTLKQSIKHSNGNNENATDPVLPVTVRATNDAGSTEKLLNITIDDDMPVATSPAAAEVDEGSTTVIKTNVMLIIDNSGSMEGGRIAAVKAAVKDLFDSGKVNAVYLVNFGSDAAVYDGSGTQNSDWVGDGTGVWVTNLSQALAAVNALSGSSGYTNYDDALNDAMNGFQAPPLDSNNNALPLVSMFLSDGEPNRPSGSAGIQSGEESTWYAWLASNGFSASYAVGFGGLDNTDQAYLEPIAWRPGETDDQYSGNQDSNVIIVTDTDTLGDVLIDAVPTTPTIGGTLTASYGADGGRILSVTVDGTTYTWNGQLAASSAVTVTDLGDNSGNLTSGNASTLVVTTDLGGKLTFNFVAGTWGYTSPASVPADATETFQYAVVDSDGDVVSTSGISGDPLQITVDVININQAPSGTDKTIATAEDTAAKVLTQADFGFTDIDGHSLLAVKITTLPGNGTLKLNGTPVVAGDTINALSIAAGQLTFTPAPDYSGNASFTFQVQDNGGTTSGGVDLDPTPNTLTINVTPVNDAPTATIANVSYNATEDINLVLKGTGLSVADADAGSGVISVTLSVGQGRLSGAAGNSGVTVGGNNTAALTLSGTLAQINAFLGAGGTSTLLYNANVNAPAATTMLALLINDNGNIGGGSLSAIDTATIYITAVGDDTDTSGDSVRTNVGNVSVAIPEWALLWDDSDPDGRMDISGIDEDTGGTASHTTGTSYYGAVNFNDNNGNANGGSSNSSFEYTASSGGGASDTSTVSITLDTSGSLDGTNGDNILIDGLAGDHTLEGEGGNDILIGNDGNDTLNGDSGNDLLVGGSGDDALNGGTGTDTAGYFDAGSGVTVNLGIGIAQNTGGAGSDTLNSIENLIGSRFGDILTGDSFGNSLVGLEGDDILIGNGGNDSLTGGDGADTFRWLAGNTGTTTITDFTKGVDSLDLAQLLTGEDDTASSLSQYLTFSFSTNTTITVDSNGSGVGSSGPTIVLAGINLQAAYGAVDAAGVINGMLGDGTLNVDTV